MTSSFHLFFWRVDTLFMTSKILIDVSIFANELNVLIVVDSFMRPKISFALSLIKPIPLFNSCYYEDKKKKERKSI